MGPREVDQFNSVTQPGVWTPEPRSPSSQRCMSQFWGWVWSVRFRPSPAQAYTCCLPGESARGSCGFRCSQLGLLPKAGYILPTCKPSAGTWDTSSTVQILTQEIAWGESPCVSSRNNRITSLVLMGALRSGLDEVHKHRAGVPNLLAPGCLSFLQSIPALLFPMPTPLIPVRTDSLPSTHFKLRN